MNQQVSWLQIVSYLDTKSLYAWASACTAHRIWFNEMKGQSKEMQIGVAMARYIRSNVLVEIQVFSQEARQYAIPRSSDSRVPPRVETIWVEQGPVISETTSFFPVVYPCIHPRRPLISLIANCNQSSSKVPILVNTTQGTRCLYTIVRVCLVNSQKEIIRQLRRYVYHKRNGDFHPIPAKEKQRWSACGSQLRFDTISTDGTCQIELEVPVHLDAMIDCYQIKQMGILLHKHVLFPLQYRCLPSPTECRIQVDCFDMKGTWLGYIHAKGNVTEDLSNIPLTAPVSGNVNLAQQTGVENLQVFKIKANVSSIDNTNVLKSKLLHPGILCIRIYSPICNILHTICLHQGTSRIHQVVVAQWTPGILEYSMAPETIDRRPLKGWITIKFDPSTDKCNEIQMTWQSLSAARLERYAARLISYMGLQSS